MLSKWEALPFKISLTHVFWQLSFSVKSFLLLEIGKNKERQQKKKKNKLFHNQSNIILLKLFLYNDFSILVILKNNQEGKCQIPCDAN